MKIFLYLHIAGLLLVVTGLYLLLLSPGTLQTVGGITWISLSLGIGLVLVSPYPVIKAIQWMGATAR